ncbi:hypothetical protein [Methylobacterium indicum]|uniref:Uncharacterized protein n=1 Tax=Methylobacterium indicum TaxID=1775910 RepID=A0A8H8WT80_9HYPH|nr:hypothetical protein [Methylobacterium indicum]BCM83829.1 hypothetical protein mvi_22900 [Methylobacterium indicum]
MPQQISSTHTTPQGSETCVLDPEGECVETEERDSLVDGRLDPDAQQPGNERPKPFDLNKNKPT